MDFLTDMKREREEWLTSMGVSEGDVQVDRERGIEFIFLPNEDVYSPLTRTFLPWSIQGKVIKQAELEANTIQ